MKSCVIAVAHGAHISRACSSRAWIFRPSPDGQARCPVAVVVSGILPIS